MLCWSEVRRSVRWDVSGLARPTGHLAPASKVKDWGEMSWTWFIDREIPMCICLCSLWLNNAISNHNLYGIVLNNTIKDNLESITSLIKWSKKMAFWTIYSQLAIRIGRTYIKCTLNVRTYTHWYLSIDESCRDISPQSLRLGRDVPWGELARFRWDHDQSPGPRLRHPGADPARGAAGQMPDERGGKSLRNKRIIFHQMHNSSHHMTILTCMRYFSPPSFV